MGCHPWDPCNNVKRGLKLARNPGGGDYEPSSHLEVRMSGGQSRASASAAQCRAVCPGQSEPRGSFRSQTFPANRAVPAYASVLPRHLLSAQSLRASKGCCATCDVCLSNKRPTVFRTEVGGPCARISDLSSPEALHSARSSLRIDHPLSKLGQLVIRPLLLIQDRVQRALVLV